MERAPKKVIKPDFSNEEKKKRGIFPAENLKPEETQVIDTNEEGESVLGARRKDKAILRARGFNLRGEKVSPDSTEENGDVPVGDLIKIGVRHQNRLASLFESIDETFARTGEVPGAGYQGFKDRAQALYAFHASVREREWRHRVKNMDSKDSGVSEEDMNYLKQMVSPGGEYEQLCGEVEHFKEYLGRSGRLKSVGDNHSGGNGTAVSLPKGSGMFPNSIQSKDERKVLQFPRSDSQQRVDTPKKKRWFDGIRNMYEALRGEGTDEHGETDPESVTRLSDFKNKPKF